MGTAATSTSALLDFKQPFNVDLLDTTIKAFYGAGSNQEVRDRHNRNCTRICLWDLRTRHRNCCDIVFELRILPRGLYDYLLRTIVLTD